MIPDGVHLGLKPEKYFAEDALGSSDLIRLAKSGAGWWWSSRHNPDYTDKRSRELNVGSALHALLLEGEGAYSDRFISAPDKRDYSEVVDTIPEMQNRLAKSGLKVKGPGARTTGWSKGDWARAMSVNLPDHPCWPNIMETFEKSVGNRTVISAVDDRMVQFMVEVATDPSRADNVEIRHLFAEGGSRPALAEVSVFATVDGVRRRYRFDRMFPRFTMDLKSLGAWTGRPLMFAAGEQLARSGWDVQRADHQEGRDLAYGFITEGRIYGGTDEQRSWLTTFPKSYPRFDYVWLVYQKPDPKGRAPVIFPIMDITQQIDVPDAGLPYWQQQGGRSDILVYGARKKQAALQLYQQMVGEFGLDRPWARIDPLHYIQEPFEPRLVIPHWIESEKPTEADAYEGDDDE